jgi:hypothetical protein
MWFVIVLDDRTEFEMGGSRGNLCKLGGKRTGVNLGRVGAVDIEN